MLRDYQLKAINEIKQKYLEGYRKIMLVAPTGAGKGVIFNHILESYAKAGKPCAMVVRGRQLVDQASERLTVDHGVLMAGHQKYKKNALINICSIDTLNSRKNYPSACAVIIDEVHMATSKAYEKLAEHYKDSLILGVTATPYTRHSLAHIAEIIIEPIKMTELFEKKYLVPGIYYVPSKINTKNIKVKAGEFSEEDSFNLLNNSKIYGNIIESYKKYLLKKPTICFAVNKKHATFIKENFEKQGFKAAVLTDENSLSERKETLTRLACGDIDIVTNVGILSTGVDMPWLMGIIMARPTMSTNLYVQQLGRGTRSYPGKDHFIVLDHAANYMRHGPIELDRKAEITHEKRKDKIWAEAALVAHICETCFRAFDKSLQKCPGCATIINVKARVIHTSHAEMVKAGVKAYVTNMDILAKADKLIHEAVSNGYKPGWIYFRLKAIYGEEKTKAIWRSAYQKYSSLLSNSSTNGR